MTGSSGAETSGNNEAVFALTRDLNDISSTSGWEEIKNTAHSDGKGNFLTRFIGRPAMFRPVTASVVERVLADRGTEVRARQAAWITHTVGFAKNVLEAESQTYQRAAIQGYDIADISPTGGHARFKAEADRSERSSRIAEEAAKTVIDEREKLPVDKPDGLWLAKQGLVVFHGLAELYGMARAGYDPSKLPDYLFASGVTGVSDRTRALLANHGEMLDILSLRDEPGERLRTIGVNVPEAMRIADSPSTGTIMTAAHQVATEAA